MGVLLLMEGGGGVDALMLTVYIWGEKTNELKFVSATFLLIFASQFKQEHLSD